MVWNLKVYLSRPSLSRTHTLQLAHSHTLQPAPSRTLQPAPCNGTLRRQRIHDGNAPATETHPATATKLRRYSFLYCVLILIIHSLCHACCVFVSVESQRFKSFATLTTNSTLRNWIPPITRLFIFRLNQVTHSPSLLFPIPNGFLSIHFQFSIPQNSLHHILFECERADKQQNRGIGTV